MENEEKYNIKCEGITTSVQIKGKGKSLKYQVKLPEFKPATMALLENIKSKLILEMDISGVEMFDQKVVERLKKQFKHRSEDLIKEELPKLSAEVKKQLTSKLIRDMLGLGNFEFLLSDEQLEEIVVNSSNEPARVYHKRYGWLVSNIKPENEAQIQNYANIIARRVGRQITTLTPLLDAHLVTGDRSNAVLFPISTKGNTITIRKFARDPWTMVDFIRNNTLSSEIFALLWLAFEYELNVLFSGGTAAGKTSMLNVCMPFIPPNHRIISIEDTRELQLPKHLYWTPLTTRQPNIEGKGEVKMLDLLVNSLRMRPDRIILGEVRRSQESEVMFEAMHTGHSVYATVHADSMLETIRRLVNPPINTPPNLLNAVDLNIVMFRDRRRGIRRAMQIGEFLLSEEGDKVYAKPNLLYRWNPNKDKIVPHSASQKLFEKLSEHTGMNMSEINKELKNKKVILDWMVKQNLRDIKSVGDVMKNYYLDPEAVLKKATTKKTVRKKK
ncbi:CpaF family protein [Candidatus Woesearchaeota archaeon]|nr:MAG: CpaF family protein [Candidatus Woesearchaeota archaeon]